ncbi:MAG: hypothetical protein ACYCX4_09005, partial [Bacillota bacterium]
SRLLSCLKKFALARFFLFRGFLLCFPPGFTPVASGMVFLHCLVFKDQLSFRATLFNISRLLAVCQLVLFASFSK